MTELKRGRVIRCLGGLYTVRVIEDDGSVSLYQCKAKGSLRRDEARVLVGDRVTLSVDRSAPDAISISETDERKNSLIRPPIANLDRIFIVISAAKPAPVLLTVDKLISIAEHNSIAVTVIITKADLDHAEALRIRELYRSVGIDSFLTSSESSEGVPELSAYVTDIMRAGESAAFAGASGVGKSTLMNRLFPCLSLRTGEISEKIERGKHTTRHVELYPLTDAPDAPFLADTPGFSLIDFSRFDFFSLEDLEPTFREIPPLAAGCRYQDCAHVGEGREDCAVMRAAEDGMIPLSRLESYREIYKTLKAKKQFG